MEIEAVRVHPVRRVAQVFRWVQDQPVVWYLLAALIVLTQILDPILTALVLVSGGGEANPLGRMLFAHHALPLVAAAKLLLALALTGVLVGFARWPAGRRSWWGTIALLAPVALTVVYALIIGWNSAAWLVLAHALPWMSGR